MKIDSDSVLRLWVPVFFALALVTPRISMGASTAGRFVVNASANTVYDKVTKLTWQRADSGLFTIDGAKTFCTKNTAALPGTGWRLPNIQELRSLVDLKAKPGLAIDIAVFTNTVPTTYWSATPAKSAAYSGAYGVDFKDGRLLKYLFANPADSSGRARCVR